MRLAKHILFILLFPILASGQSKIYQAEIDSDINLGLAPYIERAIEIAEENDADAIVFRINTFGGRVDAATKIKDAIINSKVPTIAFVDKRAISAGALITFSCQKIIMVPGASIGAATVVNQEGKKVSEKYQSYMRSEMRSTAEKNGRRTDIAEAMVDETVVIEGLVDSTKLITLTSKEALKYGIADTVLYSLDEGLSFLGYNDAEIMIIEGNWAESVINFVNNPFITSILLMVAMVGMFTEIKSPGWGIPGTASVIALAIFFGSGYLLDIVSVLDIIVFVAGIILILVEIFVIPGFGIFGIAGIILMIAGLFMGLISDFPILDYNMISSALLQITVSLVLSILGIALLFKYLPKNSAFNTLVLSDNIDKRSGYSTVNENDKLMGKTGVALTDLRPSGMATIDGHRCDVVTEGDYIEKGEEVIVIDVEGSKVVVHKKNRE